MSKKIIKISFMFMFIFILGFVSVYTFFNIKYFGSILKTNLLNISFLLILPMYHGLKQRIFVKKMVIFIYTFFIIIILIFLLILPKIKYDEAVNYLEEELSGKYIKTIIKNTEEPNFFYKGNYRINIDNKFYKIDFRNYEYELLNE